MYELGIEGKERLDSALLEIRDLCVNYGASQVLNRVNIRSPEHKICALIGPNGSGKSTTLRAVFGLLGESRGYMTDGKIRFNNVDITATRTDKIVSQGLVLVPEGRHLFPSMTVYENLEIGAYPLGDGIEKKNRLNEVLELFPHLLKRLKQRAGLLSTGEQQMVALGRALMKKPRMLVADEPTLGLSPSMVDAVIEKIIAINRSGTSVLIVEQKALRILEIADLAYLFRLGKIVKYGSGQEMKDSSILADAFLGSREQ